MLEEEDEENVPGRLGDMCTVCMTAMVVGMGQEALAVIGTCGHSFHVDCVRGWVSDHSKCPNCNAATTPADLVMLNSDVTPPSDKPIYQQIREALRELTRESVTLEQKSSVPELEATHERLKRDRNVLLVLERRNKLLADITASTATGGGGGAAGAGGGCTVRTQPGDRNVLLQLAEDLVEEFGVQQKAADKQQERVQRATIGQAQVDAEVRKLRKLIERRRRSMPEGQYDALKARGEERRRQRTASANSGTAAAAAATGGGKRPANTADDAQHRKPRFGATKEERAVKLHKITSWLSETRTARQEKAPSPVPTMVCDAVPSQREEDDLPGVDHRSFTAATTRPPKR